MSLDYGQEIYFVKSSQSAPVGKTIGSSSNLTLAYGTYSEIYVFGMFVWKAQNVNSGVETHGHYIAVSAGTNRYLEYWLGFGENSTGSPSVRCTVYYRDGTSDTSHSGSTSAWVAVNFDTLYYVKVVFKSTNGNTLSGSSVTISTSRNYSNPVLSYLVSGAITVSNNAYNYSIGWYVAEEYTNINSGDGSVLYLASLFYLVNSGGVSWNLGLAPFRTTDISGLTYFDDANSGYPTLGTDNLNGNIVVSNPYLSTLLNKSNNQATQITSLQSQITSLQSSKPLTDTSSGGGILVPTLQSPLGSFGADMATSLETLANNLDDDFTNIFPTFNFSLPYPVDGVAHMGNSLGNGFISAIETVGSGILTGFKYLIRSTGQFTDDILSLIQVQASRVEYVLHDQSPRIIGFIKRIVNVQADNPSQNYIEITKLTTALNVIQSMVPGFLTNQKLLNTRVYPEGLIKGGLFPTSFRIPSKFIFTFLSSNFSFEIWDIVLFFMLGPVFSSSKSLFVPGSQYAPFDLNDPIESLRSVVNGGSGFTFSEMSKDSIIYGTPLVFLAIVAYVLGPSVCERIVNTWQSVDPTSPTIGDVVNLMGVSHDAFYNLSGSSLQSNVDSKLASNDSRLNNLDSKISLNLHNNDSRLDNLDSKVSLALKTSDSRLNNLDSKVSLTAQTNDSRFDNLDHSLSDIYSSLSSDSELGTMLKNSFKSIYTLNKFAFVHKRDLSSVENLINLIGISGLSVDVIRASIDTIIANNNVDDSEHDQISQNNMMLDTITGILNSDIKWNEFVRVLAKYLI